MAKRNFVKNGQDILSGTKKANHHYTEEQLKQNKQQIKQEDEQKQKNEQQNQQRLIIKPSVIPSKPLNAYKQPITQLSDQKNKEIISELQLKNPNSKIPQAEESKSSKYEYNKKQHKGELKSTFEKMNLLSDKEEEKMDYYPKKYGNVTAINQQKQIKVNKQWTLNLESNNAQPKIQKQQSMQQHQKQQQQQNIKVEKKLSETIPCEICGKLISFTSYQIHLDRHKQQQQRQNLSNQLSFEEQRQWDIMQMRELQDQSELQHQNYETTIPIQIRNMFSNQENDYLEANPIDQSVYLVPMEIIDLFVGNHHAEQHQELTQEELQNQGFEKNDLNIFQTMPYNSQNFVSNSESHSCMICWNDYKFGEEIKFLHCFHFFHQNCIDEWLMKNPTCPYCKKNQKELMNEQAQYD